MIIKWIYTDVLLFLNFYYLWLLSYSLRTIAFSFSQFNNLLFNIVRFTLIRLVPWQRMWCCTGVRCRRRWLTSAVKVKVKSWDGVIGPLKFALLPRATWTACLCTKKGKNSSFSAKETTRCFSRLRDKTLQALKSTSWLYLPKLNGSSIIIIIIFIIIDINIYINIYEIYYFNPSKIWSPILIRFHILL